MQGEAVPTGQHLLTSLPVWILENEAGCSTPQAHAMRAENRVQSPCYIPASISWLGLSSGALFSQRNLYIGNQAMT